MQYVLALHNLFRWIILLLILATLIMAAGGMSGKKPFTAGNRKTALFLMISCDIQLLLGLALYFGNGWFKLLKAGGDMMKNTSERFFTIEHNVMMIIAIIFVHVGYSSVKKNIPDGSKFKRLFWLTFIALIIILVSIPWPFRQEIGRPWFRMP